MIIKHDADERRINADSCDIFFKYERNKSFWDKRIDFQFKNIKIVYFNFFIIDWWS